MSTRTQTFLSLKEKIMGKQYLPDGRMVDGWTKSSALLLMNEHDMSPMLRVDFSI
jgi:hypothetical protein